MERLAKALAVGAFGIFTAYVGASCNFDLRAYRMTHKNVHVAEGYPQDYWNYKTEVKLNDEGRLEVYYVNLKSGQGTPVNEDGTAGDCNDQLRNSMRRFKDKLEDLLEGWD